MHDMSRFDAVECCPAAHFVHVLAPDRPPLLVIEPAAHVSHDATSELAEYSPFSHTMHSLAPAALPVSVREPAKQLSQYDEAFEAWYLLDGHFTQTICSGTPWYQP